MSDALMVKSNLDGNVIDIHGDSTHKGAKLDAYPPKVGTPSLDKATQFAANQTWEVLPDPAGSHHHIIKNPATGHCIDIVDNSVKPGAALDAWSVKSSDNDNQLWDFLPDPFGSGSYFIQNPQTGYVIEIDGGSSAAGASLVVKPRRLFANNHQLWSAVGDGFSEVPLPSLTMVPAPSEFGSNNQYVLLAPNQSTNLTSIVVTIDIIEDLIADSFSIQINANAPTPADGTGARWDAQWSQYVLLMQNNELLLWNQVWHALGPDQKGDPLASQPETSASMLQLQNNTVPAGTRIVLTLSIDHGDDDFVTAVSGKIFDNGTPIGNPITWSVVGQPTFNPGGPVKESDLSPFGALSVVVVAVPGGVTNFSSGMGTITVTCDPKVTVSSQLNGPNPHGIQTAEESNAYYGEVQQGSFEQVVQPFGVLTPKITNATEQFVSGTGLYPNSPITATAKYTGGGYGTVDATIGAHPPSGPDGSFSVSLQPQKPVALYNPGTLSITVTDSQGNSAWGDIGIGVGDSFPVAATGGKQRAAW